MRRDDLKPKVSGNNIKFYYDVVNGYELKLIHLCEKYRMSEHEIANVQEIVAEIERNTYKLILAKQKEDAYKIKFKL